jgi:HD-GYP domain-containing protein (c-di-GMP phosphodiesterase class II)
MALKKQNLVNQDVEDSIDYLNLLVTSGLALGEVADSDELLSMMAETAMTMGNCEGCTVYEADEGLLRFRLTRNRVLESRGVRAPLKNYTIPIDLKTAAGFVATSKKPLNIPDVYNLPPESPFSFNPSYDVMTNYRSRSMLVIPMCDSRGNVLGVLQLINHLTGENFTGDVTPFPQRVESYLKALSSQCGVVLRNMRMAEDLKKSRIETVKKFVKASEYHDTDTGGHIERMSRYSVLLYRELGFDDSSCDVMRLASMLHDVGKISTPDAVLKKPGRLTPEEFEIMKLHTVKGYEVLRGADSPFLTMGAVIAYTHHEKWDGSGYPRGLKGEDIPAEGRVVALADVFDALCSRRVYKESWPIDKVFDELRNCSGTHFDPQIVEIFFDNLDEILEIKAQFPASDPPSTSVPPPAAKSEPQVDANASPASDSQAEIKKAS